MVDELVECEVLQSDELDIQARVGAALFASAKPLSVQTLSEAAEASEEEVEQALGEISKRISENLFGFSLCEVAGGWQFRTSVLARGVLTRLLPPRGRRLSRAAAETLAVIAYKQPVMRAEIEAIRGVDALPTLKTLLEAKLVRIVGREASVGQPALYGTTEYFLEKFGLKDLAELPTVREFVQLEAEPGETAQDSDEEGQIPEDLDAA